MLQSTAKAIKIYYNYHSKGFNPTMNHVLVIEDSKAVLAYELDQIRDKLGFPTTSAMSLTETKMILTKKKHHFFVALADLILPDAMNGEIVDLLLEHKIPTIVFTGDYSETIRDIMMNKPIVDYVLKDNFNNFDHALRLINRIYTNTYMKALIVDDSRVARHKMSACLRRLSIQSVEAESAERALEILAEDKNIQLAIIDEHMTGMTGTELTKRLRREYNSYDLCIIGISATDNSSTSIEFLKKGANDFLRKPFSDEEFTLRVLNTLELIQAVKSAREAAYKDYLTGIENRKYLYENVRKKYIKNPGQYVIAILDIDHFKKINDTHGHKFGDQVLIHVASLLKVHCEGHTLTRLGGEEFCIVFEGVTPELAYTQCEAIRRFFQMKPFTTEGVKIPLTVSIGLCSDLHASFEDALKIADQNLFTAKENGRNRVTR